MKIKIFNFCYVIEIIARTFNLSLLSIFILTAIKNVIVINEKAIKI